MALGNRSLKSVRTNLDNINKDIRYGDETNEGVYSCFNTFNYVAKNLGEWANDTVIGQSTKNNLTQLTNLLSNVIEETRKVSDKILNFCNNQENVNNKSVSNIQSGNLDISSNLQNREEEKEKIIKNTLDKFKKNGYGDTSIKNAEDWMRKQSTDDFFSVYYNSSDFEQYVSIQSF